MQTEICLLWMSDRTKYDYQDQNTTNHLRVSMGSFDLQKEGFHYRSSIQKRQFGSRVHFLA